MSAMVDTDVVVVGAGLAGLTAANRSLQQGYRVLVMEAGRDGSYLCNSRIASGSFTLANSDPTSDPGVLYDAILGNTEGAADPAQAQAIAHAIGPAMQWFRGEGAKFIKIARPGKAASNWSLAPPRPATPGFSWEGRGPDAALRCLAKKFIECGGVFSLGTRAQDLTMSGGACVGVRGVHDGSELTVHARHVVLADGGFQGNPDLVRRFISSRPECLVQRNAGTGGGDALMMAEKIGAKLVGTNRFYGHLLVQEALRNDLLWPYPTIDTLASSAVVVDRTGRRFLDEGIGGVAMANIIAGLDDPLSVTTVFDNAIWETAGRSEFTPPNPYVVSSGGTLTSAGTLTELQEALGLPLGALSETIERYNRAVQSGGASAIEPARTPGRMFAVLRSSSARAELLSIVRPPFHAIRLCAGITYTMGGIAIDGQARALDGNGQPIPGLYAAGACTGGAEGGPMAGYIGGLCKALSLGFIAAQTIATQKPTGNNRSGG
jgi:fumarate reductase flavoprotein subunit